MRRGRPPLRSARRPLPPGSPQRSHRAPSARGPRPHWPGRDPLCRLPRTRRPTGRYRRLYRADPRRLPARLPPLPALVRRYATLRPRSAGALTAFCHSRDRYLVLHMNRARATAWREPVSRVACSIDPLLPPCGVPLLPDAPPAMCQFTKLSPQYPLMLTCAQYANSRTALASAASGMGRAMM